MDLILTFEGLTNENTSTLETAMDEINGLSYEKTSSRGFQGSDELLYFISIAAGTVTILQGTVAILKVLASLIANLLFENKTGRITDVRDDQDGEIAIELLYLIRECMNKLNNELNNEHRQIPEIENRELSKRE